MTTWRELIKKEMEDKQDSSPTVHAVIDGETEEFSRNFDNGYGLPEGKSFTLWTEKRVYFPACHDGAEWVVSVPRNPCQEKTEHVGSY